VCDAENLVLNDDCFADACLRVSTGHRKGGNEQQKSANGEKLVTQLHCNTDRFTPVSYRTACAHDIANLPQASPINPIVSDGRARCVQRDAPDFSAALRFEIATESTL
jgi:hypothetical protein